MVVFDASLQTECSCQQTLRNNWHTTRASTPNRRLKNAALSGEKNRPSSRNSTVKLVEVSPVFPSAKRKAKLQPEASTGHTSPFCNRRESNASGCVSYVQSHQSTDAEHESTVVQSIAPTEIDISRKIQISVLLSNTQTPGTINCQKRGQRK